MKYHDTINFPELTFASPGIYSYTVKELTPSDGKWKTDNRVYRVIVTVTENADGILTACLDYPDGFPKFVNNYKLCPPPPPPPPPPLPPSEICKFFKKLPFPMYWFAPPRKPEYIELMKSAPDVLTLWDDCLKNFGRIYNKRD